MVAHTSNRLAILHRATRVVLVLVCLPVAMGNGLPSVWLNWHSTMVSQTVPIEEMPSEIAPVETELPAELIELSEYTTPKGSETQRRRAIACARGWLSVVQCCWPHNHGTDQPLACSLQQRHNGCGASLRC